MITRNNIFMLCISTVLDITNSSFLNLFCHWAKSLNQFSLNGLGCNYIWVDMSIYLHHIHFFVMSKIFYSFSALKMCFFDQQVAGRFNFCLFFYFLFFIFEFKKNIIWGFFDFVTPYRWSIYLWNISVWFSTLSLKAVTNIKQIKHRIWTYLYLKLSIVLVLVFSTSFSSLFSLALPLSKIYPFIA